MGDEAVAGNVQSNPHWIGDPWKVRGPDSDGSFSIPVEALNITWGNDPRYWEWLKLCETETETETEVRGFEEGAALQQVNWLEVRGKFQLPTSSKCYKVYYVMKFNEDAFGWSHAPVKFKLGDTTISEVNLNNYREKPMTWHKVYVGKLGDGNLMSSSVEVGMFQVETEWWKGGLILAGIRLHPHHHLFVT